MEEKNERQSKINLEGGGADIRPGEGGRVRNEM